MSRTDKVTLHNVFPIKHNDKVYGVWGGALCKYMELKRRVHIVFEKQFQCSIVFSLTNVLTHGSYFAIRVLSYETSVKRIGAYLVVL